MKTNPVHILIGLLLGAAVVVGGIWVLGKVLATRETYYHGEPREYWIAQVSAPDAGASNRANALLNAEIIPHLTEVMLHDTHDAAIKLALINELNGLPGVTIPFMTAYTRRKSAAYQLGEYGPAAHEAVPALLEAVNGGDRAVRQTAVSSLGSICAEPQAVIPVLVRCLDDDDVSMRAATALGGFGPLAKPAVPGLIRMLHMDDTKPQYFAREALKKIDPDAYTQVMHAGQQATNSAGPGGSDGAAMPGAK
jgi:hypothetical protein